MIRKGFKRSALLVEYLEADPRRFDSSSGTNRSSRAPVGLIVVLHVAYSFASWRGGGSEALHNEFIIKMQVAMSGWNRANAHCHMMFT